VHDEDGAADLGRDVPPERVRGHNESADRAHSARLAKDGPQVPDIGVEVSRLRGGEERGGEAKLEIRIRDET